MTRDEILIRPCGNTFGALSPEARARLLAVLQEQTQETWQAACLITVKPGWTLWAAWIAVDPTAPQRKPEHAPWPRLPDRATLERALIYIS